MWVSYWIQLEQNFKKQFLKIVQEMSNINAEAGSQQIQIPVDYLLFHKCNRTL